MNHYLVRIVEENSIQWLWGIIEADTIQEAISKATEYELFLRNLHSPAAYLEELHLMEEHTTASCKIFEGVRMEVIELPLIQPP